MPPRERRFFSILSMRVLIYGFGPYKQYTSNITQQIVSELPASRYLKKIIFDVRFDGKQFVHAVRKHHPDIVLGLGQCPSGRLMRIERRAVNRKRGDKKKRARPIIRGGPRTLATTLRLDRRLFDKRAKISRDAGDYVCNFSMYVILDYMRRRCSEARFGFVHVPHDFPLRRACGLIRRVVRDISRR